MAAADAHVEAHPAAITDDLSRRVYCILGMPVDAIEMPVVLRTIEAAAANAVPFLISTPNLNFLVNSRRSAEFRESLYISDLCPADGMPIVWIARLMGIRLQRIAGADIFQALKARPKSARPLKIYLFGATPDVAAAVARTLDRQSATLRCVGWICPRFGTIDELSGAGIIDEINSSGADLVVAALGAQNGQLWLKRNHDRLRIPVRAYLGATVNFQAGTVKRSPRALQRLGLEWLWRIKEEPYLWTRYLHDGSVFLRLLTTRVLPLAMRALVLRRMGGRQGQGLFVEQDYRGDHTVLKLFGFAIASQAEKAIPGLRAAVMREKRIVIDFSMTRTVDARFLGLLLMARKQAKARNVDLRFIGMSRRLAGIFRLNGFDVPQSSDGARC